jgi:hypothetical protein
MANEIMLFAVNAGIHREADHDVSSILLTSYCNKHKIQNFLAHEVDG